MHAHLWTREEESGDFKSNPEFYPTTESAHKRLEDTGEAGIVILCENNLGPTSAECRYFIPHNPYPQAVTLAQFHHARPK